MGGSGGQHLVTAVTVPDAHYLGSERVADKTHEIPTVRRLTGRLDLEGRRVALDALPTHAETARHLLQDGGADYLLVVQANHGGLQKTLQTLWPDSPATCSPWAERAARARPDAGTQQRA